MLEVNGLKLCGKSVHDICSTLCQVTLSHHHHQLGHHQHHQWWFIISLTCVSFFRCLALLPLSSSLPRWYWWSNIVGNYYDMTWYHMISYDMTWYDNFLSQTPNAAEQTSQPVVGRSIIIIIIISSIIIVDTTSSSSCSSIPLPSRCLIHTWP